MISKFSIEGFEKELGCHMPNRNAETLKSFAAYCRAHPDERFWQALRNWSRFDFIIGKTYTPKSACCEGLSEKDTFYFSGRDR